MSSLNLMEKREFERLFGMDSGYVLNLTNRQFAGVVADAAQIDIDTPEYAERGVSKANRLREFWRVEGDVDVGKVLTALIDILESDTFRDDIDDDLLRRCKATAGRLISGGPNLTGLKARAEEINTVYIRRQIGRMEAAVTTDPPLAIGTGKELLETICKTILADRGKPVAANMELLPLVKATIAELNLSASSDPSGSKGAEATRHLVNSLASAVQSISQLRNLYGTGHGKDGRAPSVDSRHAALAVGAATAISVFLYDAHKASLPKS